MTCPEEKHSTLSILEYLDIYAVVKLFAHAQGMAQGKDNERHTILVALVLLVMLTLWTGQISLG